MTTDLTLRQLAAAAAIVEILRRDRPEAIRDLVKRVRDRFELVEGGFQNQETLDAVWSWCEELGLACEAMRAEALVLALNWPPSIDASEHPASPDDYCIEWIPGESRNDFIERARQIFKMRRNQEVTSGHVSASTDLNARHIEWFVTFQLDRSQKFTEMAKREQVHPTTIEEAIKKIADLLGIALRERDLGRPQGIRHALDPKSNRNLLS